MNKIASIIFGIIALGNVIYSFWKYSDSTEFFGYEINVWIYRLFWSLITIKMFYDGLNKKKVN
ncbi:conserved hypothetical protein [Tenacibaculum dicentrarchi]|uniref:Uncharacterized protein n=1 Tax=Tenacibaculum dicentrarchi TaxID=669041 RepID=A0ABP1EK76_9FLAO|nr:conserved hypothetical protein [Tenacibaculum dicentrarchi]